MSGAVFHLFLTGTVYLACPSSAPAQLRLLVSLRSKKICFYSFSYNHDMWSVWHDWVRVVQCDGQSLNLQWSRAELGGKTRSSSVGLKKCWIFWDSKEVSATRREMYMFIYFQSRAVRIRRSVCKPKLPTRGFSWWFGFIILTLDAILCRYCKPWIGASCFYSSCKCWFSTKSWL